MIKPLYKREYAIYKGDDFIVMGTAKECAEEMGVNENYIYWLTTPAAARRQASRKDPTNCTFAVRVDDYNEDEEEETGWIQLNH